MEQNMTASPKRLVAKLAKVMGSISWVEKRGKNSHFGYNYAQESDIVDAVREKLASEGIFVTTSVESMDLKPTGKTTREGANIFLTLAKTKHIFHDGETGEALEVFGFGCGEDSGDKGIYKATTGAMKYFVSKNFLMSTGDDPERDDDKKAERQEPVEKPRTRSQELGHFANGVPASQHFAEMELRQANESAKDENTAKVEAFDQATKPKEEKPGQRDLGSFLATIKLGEIVRKGTNSSGAWTLYKITTEEEGAIATFSKDVYDLCGEAYEQGRQIMLHCEPGSKGPTIVEAEWPAAKPSKS